MLENAKQAYFLKSSLETMLYNFSDECNTISKKLVLSNGHIKNPKPTIEWYHTPALSTLRSISQRFFYKKCYHSQSYILQCIKLLKQYYGRRRSKMHKLWSRWVNCNVTKRSKMLINFHQNCGDYLLSDDPILCQNISSHPMPHDCYFLQEISYTIIHRIKIVGSV